MTMDDDLLRRLRRLRVEEPDAVRLERVRARCHATLLRRQHQAERRNRRRAFVARVVSWAEPTLVGGFSAVYLLAILFVLLRLRGML
jgi:hypothetical protein